MGGGSGGLGCGKGIGGGSMYVHQHTHELGWVWCVNGRMGEYTCKAKQQQQLEGARLTHTGE